MKFSNSKMTLDIVRDQDGSFVVRKIERVAGKWKTSTVRRYKMLRDAEDDLRALADHYGCVELVTRNFM